MSVTYHSSSRDEFDSVQPGLRVFFFNMKTLNYFVGEFAWFNGFETDSEASIIKGL
jgi:hypothetical protein